MSLSKKLDGFELKLRQLASKFDRQRAENEVLKTENDKLKSELDRQSGVVSSLKEKLERTQRGLHSATAPLVSAADELQTDTRSVDQAKTKAQIDQCLSEIDTCIAWLQQQ